MDAEDADTLVKRIALVIDGDIDVVEQDFREKYGEPYNDTSLLEHSWTNEVRIHWARAGLDNLGLQRLRSSITLFTNPEPVEMELRHPLTGAYTLEGGPRVSVDRKIFSVSGAPMASRRQVRLSRRFNEVASTGRQPCSGAFIDYAR